jgi:flagellar basal-body rod protein FlgB
MEINGIFGLASQQASWLSVRQKSIAENIAQANIPGYVAKDTEPFKALVARGMRGMAQTDPRHLAAPNEIDGVKVGQSKLSTGVPGEKVNVETELMKSIEVRNGYEMNTAIVKAFHRMILAASKA